MKLSDVETGKTVLIQKVGGHGAFRKRILEMGFITGKRVTVVQNAPLKDPVYYRIMDYNVSLRRQDAALIDVELVEAEAEEATAGEPLLEASADESQDNPIPTNDDPQTHTSTRSGSHRKKLRVALVGNPNCGKTSLFNLASGAHEHVGNYSGVTVDAKEAHFDHGDYRIEIVDLPGSYSLSPYSPEELYIRQFLSSPETRPDIVIDVVDTCNLERNLYLTMQIKEMKLPMVVALNMFDEFEQSKSELNIPLLSQLFDIPMVPTVGRVARGVKELFDAVVALAENPSTSDRDIKIPYGAILEPSIESLTQKIEDHLPLAKQLPARYIAVKLLEKDSEIEQTMAQLGEKGGFILSAVRYELDKMKASLGEQDTETLITDRRYGYIAGALRETLRPHKSIVRTKTDRIDRLLINPIVGFPIFLVFIFLMFECTFILGAYPQSWIEALVQYISDGVSSLLSDGPLKDLIVGGIISGVGGVIVFLPQILILYLFISVMEDTGYMARAAFMMDKLMHKMGLHGKSFIPLIMGFGCNVPAIMSSRTIESRQSRLITILVTPLMSCNARLPVYVLLAGAFFPRHAGIVFFGLYLLGIILAVLLARLFRKLFFKQEDIPFVMELPPYRIPTYKSVLIHVWDKAKEYLQKMGTIILVASVIIWFLGYFPRAEVEKRTEARITEVLNNAEVHSAKEREEIIDSIRLVGHTEQQEGSILGQMGKAIEPALAPLGFDWKMSIALLSGLPAKEVVVGAMGVIYTGNSDDSDEASVQLSERIKQEVRPDGSQAFSPLVALSFMVFVLLYFPCIATVTAVGREAGSYKWSLFVMVYTCLLAWVTSFLVYQIGSWLGF
nr:ferrous iron transport protein B [uncultured Porphyromonas sp.]